MSAATEYAYSHRNGTKIRKKVEKVETVKMLKFTSLPDVCFNFSLKYITLRPKIFKSTKYGKSI